MTSKAWYTQRLPRLMARFQPQSSNKSIEVWSTTCIVTNFGMQRNHNQVQNNCNQSELPRCSVLINPANPFLTGVRSFPYFPKGGPQPTKPPDRDPHHIMGYVTQWGGMDVGSGMLFPAAVIDGLVHQLGGKQLQKECTMLSEHSLSYVYHNQQSMTVLSEHQEVKCPVGTAVISSAGGAELKAEYDNIVHTVPPFFKYPPSLSDELSTALGIESTEESWAYDLLLSCYHQSFQLAFGQRRNCRNQWIISLLGKQLVQNPENNRVAVPLLGAGCRGFPVSMAIDAAAKGSTLWLSQTKEEKPKKDCVVAFGLLETSDAEELASEIEKLL